MGISPSSSDKDLFLNRVNQRVAILSGLASLAVVFVSLFDRNRLVAVFFAAIGVLSILYLLRWRPVVGQEDLKPWRSSVCNVMYQSWVQADPKKRSVRAPLESVENLRRDLVLVGDDSWLDSRFNNATNLTNGQPINLSEDDGPGGVWELLEGSFLVVGEAGSGKSVLVWQTLDYLIETYESEDVTPLLLEAFQWADFDDDPTVPVPRFEDFIAWQLQNPALGVPPNVAVRLAKKVVLLLDGYDELVDLDKEKARRFLDALEAARHSERIDPRIMMTSRADQYRDIVDLRSSGTAAVSHSVEVKPYSVEMMISLLENRCAYPNKLLADVKRWDSVRLVLQRPLWLSLAIKMFAQPEAQSPFAELADPTVEQCEQAMYQTWVDRIGHDQPDIWKQHVGYLALRMTTSRQTLTLEQIQGWWLPEHLHRRYLQLYRVAVGLIVGLGFGVTFGLGFGLAFGLEFGVGVGLAFGLAFGLLSGWTSGMAGRLGTPPVAQQRLDLRKLDSLNLAVGLAFGVSSGPAFGFMVRPVVGLVAGSAFGVASGLIIVLSVVLDGCLIAAPASGPPAGPASLLLADFRLKVIRGLIHGLAFGLIVGVTAGLLFGLAEGVTAGFAFGLLFGLAFGLAAGLTFGLATTGLAGVHHMVTKVMTARAGLLPFQLVPFLNDLVKSNVMYRTGAGYRFRHRTLSRWLADEWNSNPNEKLIGEQS